MHHFEVLTTQHSASTPSPDPNAQASTPSPDPNAQASTPRPTRTRKPCFPQASSEANQRPLEPDSPLTDDEESEDSDTKDEPTTPTAAQRHWQSESDCTDQ